MVMISSVSALTPAVQVRGCMVTNMQIRSADKNGTPIKTDVTGYYYILLNDKSMRYSISD